MPKTKRHKPKAVKKPVAKKPKIKRLYIWVGAAGIVLMLLLVGMGIVLRATEGTVHAQLRGNKVLPVDKPLRIHLNQDLKVTQAQVKISPSVDLDYYFVKGKFGQTELIITPKKPLKNSVEYKLEIRGLQHIVSRRQVPAQVFSFRTELAPGIAAFTPLGGQTTRDVLFK